MTRKKNRKNKSAPLHLIKNNNSSGDNNAIPDLKNNNSSGAPEIGNSTQSTIPETKSNSNSVFPVLKINGSGALPSPEVLAKYNSIIPGLAERIVAHAEKQSQHRTLMENKLVVSNIRKSYLGLVFGFLIGSLGVGGGIWLTFSGYNVTGVVFSSASLVSLVMSFIYGSQNKKNVPDSPS